MIAVGVIVLGILFSLWCMLKAGKMADESVLSTQNSVEK